MPVYDYHCDFCGYTFEVFHKVDERPEIKCNKCGRPARKLFRPVPIIFKGSGWHVTDYGRSSQSQKGKNEDKETLGKIEEPKD